MNNILKKTLTIEFDYCSLHVSLLFLSFVVYHNCNLFYQCIATDTVF
jgi:hypothetical protein